MHILNVQVILLAVSGLARAQGGCADTIIDFEDFKLVGAVGPLDPKIPNGYHDFDWSGLIVGAIAPVGQFLLPQGKNFAVHAINVATSPPTIASQNSQGIAPRSIFAGTSANTLMGTGSVPETSTITVTADFTNGSSSTTTFKFAPPGTVAGVSINAAALQHYHFPCEWSGVKKLTFAPQADNKLSSLLVLGLDNFSYR